MPYHKSTAPRGCPQDPYIVEGLLISTGNFRDIRSSCLRVRCNFRGRYLADGVWLEGKEKIKSAVEHITDYDQSLAACQRLPKGPASKCLSKGASP